MPFYEYLPFLKEFVKESLRLRSTGKKFKDFYEVQHYLIFKVTLYPPKLPKKIDIIKKYKIFCIKTYIYDKIKLLKYTYVQSIARLSLKIF